MAAPAESNSLTAPTALRIPGTFSSEWSARESAIKARYPRRDYFMRRALAGADALGIAVITALAIVAGGSAPITDAWLVLVTLPLWLLLFRGYGLYERDVKRVGHAALDDLPNLFHALAMGSLGLWVAYRLGPVKHLAALQIVFVVAGGLVLIPTLRWLARRLVADRFGPERVLLLGASPVIPALVRKMRQHGEYGLMPVGQVRSSSNGHSTIEGLRQFDALSPNDLAQVIRDQQIERLVVAADDVGDDEMLAILQQARAQALKVSLLPDYVHAMGPAMQIGDVEGITLLDLNPLVLARSSRLLKRAIDVSCSALALILFAPVMALIALAVKLDSPGPAFFRQVRVGRRGKEFRLLKFRTMTVDAEDRVEELWALSQDPNWLHLEHDPRVTRLGRILRLTSLDELPQLWNVLRGEMSLVGPRPLAKREDSRVCGWERTRLDLAPGLTGPWQVMGRTQIPFEEMTKLDYLYVTNWSLWTDVKLIMQTLPVVLNRKGAN